MAKISARGATKVESIKSVITYPADITVSGRDVTVTYTHTLCSDGRILRKMDGETYRPVAKLKAHHTDPLATFRAYVARFVAARS